MTSYNEIYVARYPKIEALMIIWTIIVAPIIPFPHSSILSFPLCLIFTSVFFVKSDYELCYYTGSVSLPAALTWSFLLVETVEARVATFQINKKKPE